MLIDDSAFPFHLMPNNIALLTQSHKAIAAKKKARREQIKEITFDDEARR
jgi:ribosomal RNA-processing protein 17